MVTSAARDIHDYEAQLQKLAFEPIQASYRRRTILKEISRIKPRRLLEVGCGMDPLFTDLHGIDTTVVEPAAKFSQHAQFLAGDRQDCHVVPGRLEDITEPLGPFDMIVVSGLLHEVEDPQALLTGIRKFCSADTRLHFSVPNARSVHRLLAVAMGLIEDPASLSSTQRILQQRTTYDVDSLHRELNEAGFTVLEHGSLFVKPFTHSQMQHLVDSGFMTPSLLDGLDQLAHTLPEFGSELWCDARLSHD